MSETFVPARALNPTSNPYTNLLANGGFEIWDNNPITTSAQNTFVIFATRWGIYQTGGTASTFILSKESTDVQNGYYSLKLQTTVAGTSAMQIYQSFSEAPGTSYPRFKNKSVAISVRVKTTIANKIKLELNFYGSGAVAKSSAYHTGSGNWETLSCTQSVTTLTGLEVRMGFIGTAVETGTVYFDDVMMVWGDTPVPFVDTDYELDKARAGAISDLQKNATNLLTNGGFEQWQRGTSFSNPLATASYVADRWLLRGSPMPTAWSVTREASNVDNGLYALNMTVTTAGGSAYLFIQQSIENYQAYAGKVVSLSIRVKTTIATASMQIDTGVSGGNSAYHTGSGNWETLSLTMIVPANALNLTVAVGQLSPVGGVVTGTIYIDSAMLVVGAFPVPFVPLHPADDLLRCQRYYQVIGKDNATSYMFLPMKVRGTTEANGPAMLPVIMAGTPTITFKSQTGFELEDATGTHLTTTGMSFSTLNPRGGRIQALVAAGLVAGYSTLLYGNSSTGYIEYEV